MSISKYFQYVLTFTVCCTAAVIISVAANMLLSIRTAEADNEVDCYKKENGITFKCDARSDDICAWTVVKKESDNLVSNPGATTTMYICTGEFKQWLVSVGPVYLWN